MVTNGMFIYREGEDVSPVTDGMVQQCKCLLDKVKTKWPQYHLDGYRNVWILKPGAKSRGRGKCLFLIYDTFDQFQ